MTGVRCRVPKPGDGHLRAFRAVLAPLDPYKPHNDQLKNGTIVFVRFTVDHSGGCTLARFFDEGVGKVRLQKDNPAYAPINCDREDIQSLAIAVERRVKM